MRLVIRWPRQRHRSSRPHYRRRVLQRRRDISGLLSAAPPLVLSERPEYKRDCCLPAVRLWTRAWIWYVYPDRLFRLIYRRFGCIWHLCMASLGVPHIAFPDPSATGDEPTRKSIEVKAMVYYGESNWCLMKVVKISNSYIGSSFKHPIIQYNRGAALQAISSARNGPQEEKNGH